MAFTLACKDTGTQCSWTGKGETVDELMEAAGKHAKEVHGYTDEQLSDPALLDQMKSLIKTE